MIFYWIVVWDTLDCWMTVSTTRQRKRVAEKNCLEFFGAVIVSPRRGNLELVRTPHHRGNLELVRTCCCQEHFNVFACDQQHICKTKLNIEYESIIILFPSHHSLIKTLVNNYDDHHTITIYGDIPPSPYTPYIIRWCTTITIYGHIPPSPYMVIHLQIWW